MSRCAGSLVGMTELRRTPLVESGQDAAASAAVQPVEDDSPRLPGAGAVFSPKGAAAALIALRRVVAADPGNAAAHNRLGEALWRQGQKEAALASFERAVELKHDCVEAMVNIGNLHTELGHAEDAADAFHLAAAFDAAAPGPWAGLARLARDADRVDESIAHIARAIALNGNDAALYFEQGMCLSRRGDAAGAAAAYQRAVALDPGLTGAWSNLGLIQLAEFGNAAAAEQSFRRALALEPSLLAARVNLGLALQEQGRFTEALAHYERELERGPCEELRWHQAIALLAMGDYGRGWEGYEARKAKPRGRRSFPYPEWDGTSLKDRKVLVYAEQGVGDEIMFASCLSDVIREAASCIIECDPRLVPLYRRSFPSAQVHGAPRDGNRDWLARYPGIDVQSAIGSLPRFFRRDAAAFPLRRRYLAADEERIGLWHDRLRSGSCGLTVGLAWRGGTRATRAALRSIPIESLAPLLRVDKVRFVNLQRGASAEELGRIGQASGIAMMASDAVLEDLDECAALVNALDLIVSVDSTLAHLCGACGVPLWLLLPYSADWRYPGHDAATRWYPSARLFRQDADRQWGPVIDRVAAELTALPHPRGAARETQAKGTEC